MTVEGGRVGAVGHDKEVRHQARERDRERVRERWRERICYSAQKDRSIRARIGSRSFALSISSRQTDQGSLKYRSGQY